MRLTIKYQEEYSRGELLLRTFFGPIYIAIPHLFVLMFVGLWGGILGMIAFWVILFTGQYPENWFNFQVGLMRWNLRLNASLGNLVDGYPAFGVSTEDDQVVLEVPYPEELSRGKLLLKAFFGFIYVIIPHGFCLLFRGIASSFVGMLAWWVVLFTGKWPENWHAFVVGTHRWSARVNLYMGNMTDEYPPFSGKE